MANPKERKNNIRVIKNEENPETPEVLAASIISISESLQKLTGQNGLTEDAIAALVCNMRGNSHLNKTEVLTVIDGLKRLKSYYVRS